MKVNDGIKALLGAPSPDRIRQLAREYGGDLEMLGALLGAVATRLVDQRDTLATLRTAPSPAYSLS